MKEDIDKINEQIDSIQKSKKKGKDIPKEESVEKTDLPLSDTKKLDDIKNLESEEVVAEEESTKKIDPVEEPKKEEQELEATEEEVKAEELFDETKKDNDKSSSKTLQYALIGVIVVLIIGLLCLLFLRHKPSSNDSVQKELSESEQKRIVTNFGTAVKGVIDLYKEKKNTSLKYEEAIELVYFDYDVYCEEHEIYDDGTLYLNSCSIDGVKTKASYGKKQEKKEVIIPEGAIKIYVPKNSGVATFDEPKDGTEYDVYGLEIKEAYKDLEFLDAKNSDYVRYAVEEGYSFIGHIVNYKTGKKAAENISYDTILAIQIGEKQYDLKYAVIGKRKSNEQYGYSYGFVNILDGTQVVSPQYDYVGHRIYSNTRCDYCFNALEEGKMLYTNTYNDNNTGGIINYTNGEHVIPQGVCYTLSISGSYLMCRDRQDNIFIYDYKGRKLFENAFDKLYWLVDGKYLLVKDGKYVKLVDINGKELYNFGEYNLNHVTFGLAYDKGALFQTVNPEKDADYDYDKDDSCLEFIYHGETKKGEVKTSYCGGIAKPILYLYPKKKTKVTVSFAHPELLETTYPKFIEKWEMTASPNGDLYDNSGKYYYGLYWDETKVHSVDFSSGFYVEKDEAIDFLEEKLSIIGLNDKERNEFIMYWLPILEKNEKNLVYFELTEEREKVNQLFITPKPDSLLRIVIHVKKVNEKTSILEEKLPTFKRKGFVAIEWGGTTY